VRFSAAIKEKRKVAKPFRSMPIERMDSAPMLGLRRCASIIPTMSRSAACASTPCGTPRAPSPSSRATTAGFEVFNLGVLRSARKMAELLDEEGAPSSWEKQFATLKNWRRSFAAGKLGTKYGLLGDDTVKVGGPSVRWAGGTRRRPSSTRPRHSPSTSAPSPPSQAGGNPPPP